MSKSCRQTDRASPWRRRSARRTPRWWTTACAALRAKMVLFERRQPLASVYRPSVVHPAALEQPLDGGKAQDDNEQDVRHGRRVAHLEVHECCFPDVQDQNV